MRFIAKIIEQIEKAKDSFVILLIFITAFLVYGNTLLNGFVYDDLNYIINNPQVHSLNPRVLFGQNLFNMAGQYRPIMATYAAAVYSIFGPSAFFFHLIQILIHICVVILLFHTFQKFLNKATSFALSILFLVHPMNVEAVSYIASTGDALFNLFGLCAFLIYSSKTEGKRNYFVFLLLLLSILTREEGVIYTLLMILYFAIFDRQKLLKFSLIGFLVIVSYLIVRIFIGQVYFTTRLLAPIASQTFIERLKNIPLIIFHYITTFFYPSSLAVDQQWLVKTITFSSFYLPLIVSFIAFSAILAAGFFIHKHRPQKTPIFVFFSLWALIGIAPHLQLFPLDFTVTNRWFYFPMMGTLGALGTFYLYLNGKIKIPKIITFAILSITILLLSYRTILRNFDWKDNLTLFSHDIQIEDNFDIEIFLGNEYLDKGDNEKGVYYLNKSVALRPNEFNLHNLGVAYERMGNLQKAREIYYQALNAKEYYIFYPHHHDISSYNSYASMLVFFDKPTTAEEFVNEALKDYPNADSLWFFLSLSKLKQGDKAEALRAAEKAYSLNPSQENTYLYSNLLNNQDVSISVYGKSFNF